MSDLGRGKRARQISANAQLQLENEEERRAARNKRNKKRTIKSQAEAAATAAAGTALLALSSHDTATTKKKKSTKKISVLTVDNDSEKIHASTTSRALSRTRENSSNRNAKRTKKKATEAQPQVENEQAATRAAAAVLPPNGRGEKKQSRKKRSAESSSDNMVVVGSDKDDCSQQVVNNNDEKRPSKKKHKSDASKPAAVPPPTERFVTLLAYQENLEEQRNELVKTHTAKMNFLQQKHKAVIKAVKEKLKQDHAEKSTKRDAKIYQLQTELSETNKKRKADAKRIKALEKQVEQLQGISGSTRKRKIGPIHSANWNKRFEELKEFKAVHGHCNVSIKENAELGFWVCRQRANHKLYARGEASALTPEQIQKLNSIGFGWANLIRSGSDRLSWNERFQQLLEYKEKHGHVRVPHLHKEPVGLGEWVSDMRAAYKIQYKGAKYSKNRKITPEQVAKLESIGFEWSLRNRRKKGQNSNNATGTQRDNAGMEPAVATNSGSSLFDVFGEAGSLWARGLS